jgi:hypothetical protein
MPPINISQNTNFDVNLTNIVNNSTNLNNKLINKHESITLFKSQPKTYDNFAIEFINIDNKKYILDDIINEICNITIKRDADIIDNIFFKISFDNILKSESGIYNYKFIEELCRLIFNNLCIELFIGSNHIANNLRLINPNIFNDSRYVSWNVNELIINFKPFINNYIYILCADFDERTLYLRYNNIKTLRFNINKNIDIYIKNLVNKYKNTNSNIINDSLQYYDNIMNNINKCKVSIFKTVAQLDLDERKRIHDSELNLIHTYNDIIQKNINHQNYEINDEITYVLRKQNLNKLAYILFSITDENYNTVLFNGNINFKMNHISIVNGSKSSSFYKNQYLDLLKNKQINTLSNNENDNIMALSFTTDMDGNDNTGYLDLNNINGDSINITFNGNIIPNNNSNTYTFNYVFVYKTMLQYKNGLAGVINKGKEDIYIKQ